jgi:predicted nucleic acid-binding protein
VELADKAFLAGYAVLPPVVVTELLSDPQLPPSLRRQIMGLPRLAIFDSYWEDAGLLRQQLLSRGLKARLSCALIASCCIQNDMDLVARDPEYRHFVNIGLRLLP